MDSSASAVLLTTPIIMSNPTLVATTRNTLSCALFPPPSDKMQRFSDTRSKMQHLHFSKQPTWNMIMLGTNAR
jgi:hypothetical protein